ncbi:DOMON-like domain-containing protein [Altererythrobacter sp. C41]|uniref:DOMON-like domain-containing protein n=1 Tax=Altererythrobacter sp. C41 TaxID=2806021 RepID=UPI0019322CE0|nr:DOMON-like domain-containing protein [Altererythrobacter sp. C41]MBM0168753.1 DOMON-like domain-containing protein [Altererythrobacter sp. C41]
MQTHELTAHPDHPPLAVTRIEARILTSDSEWLRLRWRIEGIGALVVPPFAGRGRADELWRTTCFELFLRPEGGAAYCEINLSPSERWAAYDFTGYREGMSERPFPREPDCTMRLGSAMAIFDATVPRAGLPRAECAAGLSAVIEETGGIKSYWAMVHPEGPPDFHNDACFAARLAAPAPA